MTQTIYDHRNAYLAEVKDMGNDIRIYQKTKFLGYYNKSSNRTYNAHGGFIGEGNLLTMLIEH